MPLNACFMYTVRLIKRLVQLKGRLTDSDAWQIYPYAFSGRERGGSRNKRSCLDSFNKLLLQKEELEQKHLHLLQIVESEKTAKWQYTQQCEELTTEIKKLRNEVSAAKPRRRCPLFFIISPEVQATITG